MQVLCAQVPGKNAYLCRAGRGQQGGPATAIPGGANEPLGLLIKKP